MGWKNATEAAEKVSGGIFVRLEKDGDSAILCFPYTGDRDEDDPFVSETYWDDKLEKAVPYSAEHRAAGKDPSPKFKFKCFEKPGKDEKLSLDAKDLKDHMKIYECSAATFKNILECKEKYAPQKDGGMAGIWFEIKRHGAKGSKKTKYSALYDGEVTKEMRDAFAAIPDKDRRDVRKTSDDDDTKKQNGATAGGGANGTALIDDASFKEIAGPIKEMTEDKRREFLKEFGISRGRELKQADVPRAKEWIAKNKPGATQAADFD